MINRLKIGRLLMPLAALLLWAAVASAQINGGLASKHLVVWGGASIAQNTTTYAVPSGDAAVGITTAGVPLPFAGTIRNLTVFVTTLPAGGQTFTFTLVYGTTLAGLATTTLTCQITSATTNQFCTDGTHSLAAAAGSLVSIQSVTSATSGATGQLEFLFELDPS
jgi:hypothetical protein